MGNLSSVVKAGKALGASIVITDSTGSIKTADKLILPGVGHFGKAVRELKKRKIFALIKDRVNEGVPFLGICLGMQLVFERSQEAPAIRGLGLVKGTVKKFLGKNLIVPHMGWNQVKLQRARGKGQGTNLFRGVKDGSFFYFAHSYYCAPKEKGVILTTTRYGRMFASSLNRDNIWAVQFHPEKSQMLGLKVFKNFLLLC